MFNDKIKVTGKLNITLINELGIVTEDIEIDNLVVTAGKGYIASRMKDASATAMSHMAIGTGSTSPAAGNTGLGSESNRQSLASTNVSGADVTYACTFGAGNGTGAITEAGIFNASSGGTMLCRTTFSVINKGANDTLSVSWVVTVG